MNDLLNQYTKILNDYNKFRDDYFNLLKTTEQESKTRTIALANDNSFIIIGVGTDGRLYSKADIDAQWILIDDNSQGLQTVCKMNDGKGLLGTMNMTIYTKQHYLDNWSGPIKSPCCVLDVAMGEDGTIVGVGQDNKLWSKSSLNDNWGQAASPGEWCSSVAIAPDGSIYVSGGDLNIYKKESYKNLASQAWQNVGNCCVYTSIDITNTGMFIVIGSGNALWSKPNYKTITTDSYTGPHASSCCVVSVTSVTNDPKQVNVSKKFKTIKGYSFLGKGEIKRLSTTLNNCSELCENDDNCTGANFNNSNNSDCSLRYGEGDIMPSISEGAYAIVSLKQQYLQRMQGLNMQLTEINNKIISITGTPSSELTNEGNQLKHEYDKLKQERERINKLMNEYEDLEETNNYSYLNVSSFYNKYIYYSIIVILSIILIILIMKNMH